jgi:pimeloyl-ACP methyl ester carboxylesterase
VFDAYFATQVPFVANFAATETKFRLAGGELLDRIGRAILITHSQGGELGWALADARPGAVAAIVAVEPYGPPFRAGSQLAGHAARTLSLEGNSSSWGITETPLHCEPEVADAGLLRQAWERRRNAEGGPHHPVGDTPTVKGLVGVPVLMVTGSASYHAEYDHLAADFLRMVGAEVAELRLGEQGLVGNGHMMMLEDNSDDIAALIVTWLEELANRSAIR